MKQKYISISLYSALTGGLYIALMGVCIYGLTCLNQFEKSLNKHF